jgi:hypothetical protein
VNPQPAIIHAIGQWFLGRISDAEQEEDITALIAEAEEYGHLGIRDELTIGYRVTWSFLHKVCQDVYVENGDNYAWPAGLECVQDWYEGQR